MHPIVQVLGFKTIPMGSYLGEYLTIARSNCWSEGSDTWTEADNCASSIRPPLNGHKAPKLQAQPPETLNSIITNPEPEV